MTPEEVAWALAMRIEHAIRPKLPNPPRLKVTVESWHMRQLVIEELHFQVAAAVDFEVGKINFVHLEDR